MTVFEEKASLKERVQMIRDELPPSIRLVAAAKSQPPELVLEAVEAGIRILGENYVQEAAAHFAAIGRRAEWHFIGHLQKNKAKKAVEIFDMIETLDSVDLAAELDKRSAAAGKTMSVLIEVNSGRESQKFGVFPENVESLVRSLAPFRNLKVQGLMTMGPFEGNPEDARPYFRETKRVFEALKAQDIPGVEMRHLSMGMTNSYKVALEEGATMIRIGTKIFGPRI